MSRATPLRHGSSAHRRQAQGGTKPGELLNLPVAVVQSGTQDEESYRVSRVLRLHTRDTQLDVEARSSVGARGLMQIMPFHSGKYGCASPDLYNVEANICHGVAILAEYMGKTKSIEKALLRYNGCVRGANTPNCHTYPNKVLRYSRTAASQMMTELPE